MPDFSFETTISVRFQDFDMMGHVNNAVYATYLEEARTSYLSSVLGVGAEDISTVLAHLELDFVSPLTASESVTVGVDTTAVGEKSYTFAYELSADGTVVATAETVQVWIDPETGSAVRIPDELREKLATQCTAATG